mmetsp:Transcript_33994/g.52146  ORF Transcript_33994/g.52146 Transcript_33994/m.52146 type:complete len:84 (-) Transcript_33994:201-452(-)
MAISAVRWVINSLVTDKPLHDINHDLTFVVGQGLNRATDPVLPEAVKRVLTDEYVLQCYSPKTNLGRIVVQSKQLKAHVDLWR